MKHISDQLILQAAKGNQQACAVIYSEISSYVRGVIFNLTSRKDTRWLKEMSHEILTHILRPEILSRYIPSSNFQGWVAVIAKNKCIDALKSKKNNSSLLDSLDAHPAGYDVLCHKSSVLGKSESADGKIIKKENAQLLWDAIDNHLNADMKRFIQLWYVEELNQEEIAQCTGWSESNIGVIHHRVKNKLRELLKNKIL